MPGPDLCRNQLCDISVDGNQLNSDADTGDESPEVDRQGTALDRHITVAEAVPQQREGERSPAGHTGQPASKADGAKKQSQESDGREGT